MSILVITPDPTTLLPLIEGLDGQAPVFESQLSGGLARLRDRHWSLVLVDTAVYDGPIGEIIAPIAAARHPVAVLTRSALLPVTASALKCGAVDVLPFPPTVSELRRLLTRGALPAVPPDSSRPNGKPTTMIGGSRDLLAVVKTAARMAKSSATVLLQGETGTGKELLARLIHENSGRAHRAFVAVNCAAIPEPLLETELFGHEKGAFTGAVGSRVGRLERASGGTLFLDEVSDMSLSLQAKILRAVQEHEIERVGGERPIQVDLRVIAATNRDLESEVRAGRFREDLYYRLAVAILVLPPLRERGDDIRLLAELFAERFSHEHGRRVCEIADETMGLLRAYPWPGNVRQLQNVVERAVLLCDGPALLPEHLPTEIRTCGSCFRAHLEPRDRLLTLRELEERHIRKVLEVTAGHLVRAAHILGIHRNTLRRKLHEHNLIEPPGLSESAIAISSRTAALLGPNGRLDS